MFDAVVVVMMQHYTFLDRGGNGVALLLAADTLTSPCGSHATSLVGVVIMMDRPKRPLACYGGRVR